MPDPANTGPSGGPVACTVKVIVEGSIASLNVALTALLVATPVALSAGFVRITVGAALSRAAPPAPVVKVHMKFAASALPARSPAPVVIVAVNRVLSGSVAGVVGVKVAVLATAAYVTFPATVVPPSVVFTTVKVVLPIVAGFIASLKVAVGLEVVKTPVAALPRIVEVTMGLVG